MITDIELFYSALIGLVGAGAYVFASYLGLSGYPELSKKLYSRRNLMIYLVIDGLTEDLLSGIREKQNSQKKEQQ